MKLINPEVRIETTNLCNAKCIMCPRDELTRPKASMSYEHCKNLIDQADTLGAELISLFGYGEPLIDTSLGAKIRYCTQLGLKTFITTNASLLESPLRTSRRPKPRRTTSVINSGYGSVIGRG